MTSSNVLLNPLPNALRSLLHLSAILDCLRIKILFFLLLLVFNFVLFPPLFLSSSYAAQSSEAILLSDHQWHESWWKVFAVGEDPHTPKNEAKTEKMAVLNLLQILKRSKTASLLMDLAMQKIKVKEQGYKKNNMFLSSLQNRAITNSSHLSAQRPLSLNSAELSLPSLSDVIKMGQVSITDMTVMRKFLSESPDQVTYEYKQMIYLNKELTLEQATLDLAHELTHFVFRAPHNPYEHNTSLVDFIRQTIEATGGEAHAALMECRVSEELFNHHANLTNSNNASSSNTDLCSQLKLQGQWSLQKTIQLFYHVGSDFDQFVTHFTSRSGRALASDVVTNNFPWLSKAQSFFISSAYGMSYPVAAIAEYEKIEKSVCQNEVKRQKLMQAALSTTSISSDKKIHLGRALASLSSRCSFTSDSSASPSLAQ